jgi:hypothetical protein
MQFLTREGSFDGGLRKQINSNFSQLGSALGSPAAGTTYWADANSGNDGADGLSPATAFRTIAKAFTVIASGDTIRLRGKFREQLVTPVQVFDVTVIGDGTRPRHADATPDGGQKATATWTDPVTPTAGQALVDVRQQGWRFVNILFAANATGAAIRLYRDAGAGNLERDASHAEILGCRFASGLNGISDTGGCADVLVAGNRFEALTGFCILGVGNIGVGQSDWYVRGNTFDGFTNGVKIAAFGCRVQDNTFTAGGTPNTTVVLNMTNGGGDNNFIVANFFQTATANFNTPDVVGAATDVWAVNASIDSTSAGVGGNYEWGRPA